MDISSNQLTSAASPSSSSPKKPWDVFLNFHGKDTRNNFIAHLYFTLNQSAIRTYKDDSELERGQEISSGLFKAIQDSKVSIVVLSNNYASSWWCLEELVEILACMKTKGRVVRPVFYHVDPSTVRYQKDSFGKALVSHEKYYPDEKIEKWRAALTEISHLHGYHIGKDANEAENIQMILQDVASLVSTKAKHLEGHLVGIDSAVEEIYEKLNMHSNDVRAIGICGMGGIGKTTVAKAFYNKYCDKFNSSCFVENVKKTLQAPDNLLSLLNQLLVQLLRIKDYIVVDVERGIRELNEIFSSQKVLIVLDDFDESDDLEIIIRRCNSFSPESRIIMTTRDTNLLTRLGIDIYMVKKLGGNESLELFSYHAFRTTVPLNDYTYLSKGFVEYVDGIPLALKVLGSYLRGKNVSFWKANLERVTKDPEDKIHNVLRLSYDELSDTVKDMFLDIVFFFVGKEKDAAVWVFESCGFIPDNGIPILLERCLLTVENNKLNMHNLIQNMGWKVIHQESQEPGKRKRLICQENAFLRKRKRYAFQMFNYQEGTDKIEGLILDLTSWTQRDLSLNIFEMMPKLRLLEIVNAPRDLKINFENSFQELRCIRWHHCPWKRLPSNFRPQKLVILDMQFSNFRTLWKGSLPFENLRSVNLSWSKRLETIPNFDKVKMLEKLSLRRCENLLKLDKSLVQLSKLSHLELGECQNLKQLPRRIGQLDELRSLDLGGCHVLKGLPDSIRQLTWLTELCLRECYSLIQLPESVGHMKGLKRLDARGINIEQLPDSICQLKNLYGLNLGECKKLRTLPEQIGNMKSLRTFVASGSALRQLPDSFEDLINLSDLRLENCRNLERLPGQLGKMKCLESLVASNTAIEEVPDSIAQLTSLQELQLDGCKKLGEIPGGIWSLTSLTTLVVENRKSHESLPDSVKNMKRLHQLRVRCNIRLCLPTILCLTSLRYLILRDTGESLSSTKPFSLSNLSNLEILRLEDCKSLGSCLPELPLNLKWLEVERYESLEELPDLSTFLNLTNLSIRKCNRLRSIPLLPPPHLQHLGIHDCRSLRDTHHDYITTTFKDLEDLAFNKCSNLIFNTQPTFLQVLHSRFYFGPPSDEEEILKRVGKQRSEHKVECVVPQMFSPNNSFYIALQVDYNCTTYVKFHITAVVTSTKTPSSGYIHYLGSGRVGSVIICHRLVDKYPPGDRLTISFEVRVDEQNVKNSDGYFKLDKCEVHIMFSSDGSSTENECGHNIRWLL